MSSNEKYKNVSNARLNEIRFFMFSPLEPRINGGSEVSFFLFLIIGSSFQASFIYLVIKDKTTQSTFSSLIIFK